MTDDARLSDHYNRNAEPYRYRQCGLDGIFLLNGYEWHEHDGARHVSITDIDGLHTAIGRHLVLHRQALAPQEIKFLRKTLGLSQAELAEDLGKTSQSVARWEKGVNDIPTSAEKLLRAIYFARTATSDADLQQLRLMLSQAPKELDSMHEVETCPAQFSLMDQWTQQEAA